MKLPLAALSLLTLAGWSMPARATEPDPPGPWAATLRAGAFVLRSPGVAGHPAGPDVELSLDRTIFEQVSVEVSAGRYQADLTASGTRLTVYPFTVSLRMAAPTELGFEPYLVAGLGLALTRLAGGSLAAASSATAAFHAGIGVRRQLGEALYAGLEGRYVFQDAADPVRRLDGLRFSALAGLRF